MARSRFFDRSDIPLEVVILLLAGMTMLITGSLLLPVYAGTLPYYENGLYGLLLFIFALQVVALGKTPFGDLRRSVPLVTAGVIVAGMGISTCFVPDVFSEISRLLLFLCLAPGSLVLLVQLFLSREKARSWVKHCRLFQRLTFGCAAVYLLSILAGLLIWKKDLLSPSATAVAVLVYGVAIVHLALVLRKVYGSYPAAAEPRDGTLRLPIDRAMILLTGVFMVLLGLLLLPVNFGLLPFSGSAQLGLLVVILSLQMLSTGSTPIGPYPRSRFMILLGFAFGSLGVVSCIIPGILVKLLTFLIAFLNIAGGAIALSRMGLVKKKKPGEPGIPVPPILTRLNSVQLAMNLVSIVFGFSMLFSGLLPGTVIGVMLAANGGLLLYMLRILAQLDRLQQKGEAAE